jgi:hypothetical protein
MSPATSCSSNLETIAHILFPLPLEFLMPALTDYEFGLRTLEAVILSDRTKDMAQAKRDLKDWAWAKKLHRSVHLVWTELQKWPLFNMTVDEKRIVAREAVMKWRLELTF